MNPWIDSHNHLHDQRLAAGIDRWWPQWRAAGVRAAVVNGTSPADWPALAELQRRHPQQVFASYGLHPWRVRDAPPDWCDQLQRRLDTSPCVGIGEIGLDKWIRPPDLPAQREAFAWQWRLAVDRGLPVTVHCLRAWGHLLELLRDLPPAPRGFLLHSFAGPAELLPELLAMGAHASFSGHLMHPRKRPVADLFRAAVPADRLHVETDAPDMTPPDDGSMRWLDAEASPATAAPDPARRLNHPANLPHIGAFLAGLRGLSVARTADLCRANTARLFRLPHRPIMDPAHPTGRLGRPDP